MLGDLTDGRFYTEPLIGYRTWRMTEDAELAGVVYSTFHWSMDEDAAGECLRTERPGKARHKSQHVPAKDCQCGLYAYWDYPTLQAISTCFGGQVITIRGAVIGWGKIWLAEHGWRAKYARPVALLHWPERRNAPQIDFDAAKHAALAFKWNEVEMKVADRYACPLVDTPAELEAIAKTSNG